MNHGKKQQKEKGCPVRCSTEVGMDLDVKPRVDCRELSRRGTEFDIELEFEVDHHCRLVPKKQYKDDCGCVTRCVFGVELDFTCVPKVLHRPCRKPEAVFELDVELGVSPHCKPIDDCKVRYYSAEKKKEKKDTKKKKAHESEESDYDDCEFNDYKNKEKDSKSYWI